VSVVLDEAEAAGSFGEAVETHDEAFDLAAFAEEFMDLLFGGVEGAEGARSDKIFPLLM
jgi:hypothetical protein